jgi:hypothetical protein
MKNLKFWRDSFIKWDPDKYGGLNSIRLPASQLYTPDIVLFNNADTRVEENHEALVIVNSDGEIQWYLLD